MVHYYRYGVGRRDRPPLYRAFRRTPARDKPLTGRLPFYGRTAVEREDVQRLSGPVYLVGTECHGREIAHQFQLRRVGHQDPEQQQPD